MRIYINLCLNFDYMLTDISQIFGRLCMQQKMLVSIYWFDYNILPADHQLRQPWFTWKKFSFCHINCCISFIMFFLVNYSNCGTYCRCLSSFKNFLYFFLVSIPQSYTNHVSSTHVGSCSSESRVATSIDNGRSLIWNLHGEGAKIK